MFKASRGVAAKHVALRQHQLDVYGKTSSLAKAVKSQTDRVTLTVTAASVLAERFNGPGFDYSTQASQSSRSPQRASIPSQDGASGTTEKSEKKDGLSKDHAYKRYPLPDGSSFPADTAEVPKPDKVLYSGLSKKKLVKAPLADGRKETDESIQPTSSGRTSISHPAEGIDPAIAEKAKRLQRQAEKQIPSQPSELPPTAHSEEPALKACQDRDVFYSPSSSDGRVLSALPRVKLPKNTEDAQESDEHVPDAQINQEVFYSSSSKSEEQPVPEAQDVPEQEQMSDEARTELFHSPRVARMLGGQPWPSKPSKGLMMSGAQETPMKQTKPPRAKDQVSSSIRTLGQESQDGARNPPTEIVDSKPSQAEGSDDVHDLAADMAKDAEAMSVDASEASSLREMSMILALID